MMNYFGWGSTIAMSWLWGLGFFFSIHFSYTYGWIGLFAFAIPNALGLYFFGLGLRHLGKSTDLTNWLESKLQSWSAPFFAYQVVAISLTLFAVMKYLFGELGLDVPVAWTIALLALAMLLAELAGLAGLVRLHIVYFILFLALGLSLLFASPVLESPVDPAPFDVTFGGIVIALIVSLLFGPWLDLQQWQRAIAMHQAGDNIERGFATGAALFFVLLLVLGALTIAFVPTVSSHTVSALDGRFHGGGVLTSALQSLGLTLPLLTFALLAGLAIISTLESGQLALRWHLSFLNRTSNNPIVGMLPENLRVSTVPTLALTFLIAWGALLFGADIEHFMIFFASIFLAGSVALVLSVVRPDAPVIPNGIVFLVGVFALAVLAIGYFELQPVLMMVGVAIPIIVLPTFVLFSEVKSSNSSQALATVKKEPSSASAPTLQTLAMVNDKAAKRTSSDVAQFSSNETSVPAEEGQSSNGWFEDRWFTIPHIPTYTDTNSVGNVYFANYVSWVGKARELFFRTCMPDFNLDDTDFFILTRSFNHKFVREIREFQAVHIKLRIGEFNRKFVKLEHQIESMEGGLIGSGEQTLMFVGSSNYGLIDIPGSVYSAFIPYAPTGDDAKA